MLYDHTRQTKVDVELAVVDHRTFPVTTTMAIDDQDPWKSSREDGHPVLATEFYGRLTEENSSNDRSASCLNKSRIYPSKSDNTGSIFVSCFPSTVTNTVFVPKTCLIPVKEFKGHYRPGLMHECILYLTVFEETKAKSPIGIIYDKNMGLDINLLKSILNAVKRKVVFLLDVVDFIEKCKMEGQCQLVLLLDNSNSLVRMSSKLCVLATKIIAPSHYINKSKERILRQRLPNTEIYIINYDEIMSERRLEMQVKTLRSLLAKVDCITPSSSVGQEGISIVNFNPNSQMNNCIQAPSVAVKTDKSRIFNKSAGYLIVGGLTGLGWETVNLIAAMGGGCIATIARSIPTEDKLSEIKSLEEKHCCQIISLQGDVANYESLKKAFDRYQEECPSHPLKGVFHGAAVLEDAIIVHMTEEKFEKVLKPKVLGTLHLHSLTQNMNLDYFVLQSSITSIFGNSGQTNYGAGNAFMDTFAFYRRSIGISGQTINWGALHLGLLTAFENVERHLNTQGYQSLKPDEIMECFLHALCKNFTQMVYGIFKWETIVRQSPDMIHLTSKLLPILTELNLLDIFTSKQNNKINIDIEEIMRLSEEKRQAKIIDALKMIVADAFVIELSSTDETTSFVNLGIDSMKGMSLINNIYEYLSCRIPVIAVLEQDANIESIAKLILQQFAVSSEVSGIVPVDKLLMVKNELKGRCVDLNFIERELFQRQLDDPSSFNFFQIEINLYDKTIDFKVVRKAFSKLLSIYSFLDSFYIQDDDAIGRVPGEIMNQDQEDESRNQTVLQALGNMQQVFKIDRRFRGGLFSSNYQSDPMSATKNIIFEGRVVKIIFENQQECCKTTILCDRMLFDKESTVNLAFHFMSLIENDTVDIDQGLFGAVNAAELEEGLNILKDDFEKFWPMLLSQNIKPVMFREKIADKSRNIDIEIATVKFPNDLSKSVHRYLHRNTISIKEFFISIYQLFLHFTSNNAVISVASYVDVRSFLNGSKACGGLENCIPFIAEINNDTQTITNFLLHNAETIRKCTRLSLLPWTYMESLFANTLIGVNAFMHCVAVDQNVLDDDCFSTLRVKLNSITCFESRFHTAVHIKDQGEDEPILMSLHSNPQLVDTKISTKILEGLQKMIEAITEIENLTVKQMKTKFQTLKERLPENESDIKSVVNENDLTTKTHGEEDVLYKGKSRYAA